MNTLILRSKYILRQRLSRHSWAFFLLYSRFSKGRRYLINNGTRIVIEGFPRSGNTFALWAYIQSNPNCGIAHHSHSQAQLVVAVKKRIPLLVVIREPEAAIRSLLVRHPHITPRLALTSYLDFHRQVQQLLPHLVLATIQETTSDFGAVMRRVNQKFNSDFNELVHNAEANRQILENIDQANAAAYGGLSVAKLPRPHPEKEQRKQSVNLDDISQGLGKAKKLYAELISQRQD